jgi:hypothetical protein
MELQRRAGASSPIAGVHVSGLVTELRELRYDLPESLCDSSQLVYGVFVDPWPRRSSSMVWCGAVAVDGHERR